MKYLVIFAFVAIIASLGSALFFLMKNDVNGSSRSQKMARALAMRVGISILLFICILLAWRLGWIHPTGIAAGQ
jgi:cytochrome bd-type quinol oxidase subunit 2